MSSDRNFWTASSAPRRSVAREAPPRRRRLLLDGVGVVATLVFIAGAVLFLRTRQEKEAMIERAAGELRRVELELKYRAAARLPGLNERGWPEKIDREWFNGPSGVPANPLVSPERPWVDLASAEEHDLDHPLMKMAADPRAAGFWYNPALGVVRARVPVLVSDEETLELYNRVNGTRLASIFETGLHHHDEPRASADDAGSGERRPAIEITTTGQVRRRADK